VRQELLVGRVNIAQNWNCFTARATPTYYFCHASTSYQYYRSKLYLLSNTAIVTVQYRFDSTQHFCHLIITIILYGFIKKMCCILYSSTFIFIVSFYLFWLKRNSIKYAKKLIGTTFENVKCLNVYFMQGGYNMI